MQLTASSDPDNVLYFPPNNKPLQLLRLPLLSDINALSNGLSAPVYKRLCLLLRASDTQKAFFCAELAVGNIVRRVLHMIREESQHEAEDEEPQLQQSPAAVAVPEAQGEQGPGLLSKMLRQPSSLGVRTISLHNLLDQPPVASQPQPPAVVSHL